ncbi:MAG: LysM peptidoglycan-binding domain-containing protein [Candidatus Syntrophonatronum acetioxidans]|uniref:LysM peptidoglycan-binding domain-containing protein n=1 Tax=Candidatus Syntrophonatronum acetioxidans TaxID=1795816 RepID=A0A424YA34_9FIRM|nr:MAG: LysM peptidoglycan-binding domain-containing protein [Candidatus Syntrophonatronum acetioxidans]
MMKKSFWAGALIIMLLLFLAPSLAQAALVHRVAPGESLYSIAKDRGIGMEKILEKNDLINPHQLYPGQVLIIPREEKTYIVQPGDTLFKISTHLQIPLRELARANNINNWNLIYVGQPLVLPPLGSTPGLQPPPPETSYEYTLSQLVRMFPETFFLRGSFHTRTLALTFDDGPDGRYTPQVLDVLKEYQVPATFYLMGSRAERHPEVVKRIVEEGHVIGNHSWSHPDLRRLSKERLIEEILKTESILEKITGLKTALMRPPYGGVNKEILKTMKSLEYRVINWSVDSVDWRDREVDQILLNTLPDTNNGGILLFHSAGGEGQSMAATVEVLPELINTLRFMGYNFVTVDELLGIPPYK